MWTAKKDRERWLPWANRVAYHIFGRRQREKTENKASWCNASSSVDGSSHLLFENMFVAVSFQNKQEGKTSIERCFLIIATVYVKPWLGCSLAVKVPYQDLCFSKTLKGPDLLSTKRWIKGHSLMMMSMKKPRCRIVDNLERECFSNPCGLEGSEFSQCLPLYVL